MSLIVDANCASLTFSDPPSDDFKPVLHALYCGNAKLVIGGKKLQEEYKKRVFSD